MLFDGASASPTDSSSSTMGPSDTSLIETGNYISVLAAVGQAMAIEAEAGEELDQISAGSLAVQVCVIAAPHKI